MMRVQATLLIVLACSVSVCWAQQGRGTILGTVTDSSGAAVTDAHVSIVNTQTNTTVAAQTNSDGNYTSPPLIVGDYEVTAEHNGFKKTVRTGIGLQVDQHAVVNLELELGTVGESVQVTAAVPLVNTEDATIGQVIENKRVEALPINGRSAFALIGLAANVKSNAGPPRAGSPIAAPISAPSASTAVPASINYFLVDGMVAIQSYYPDLNADLAVDAVQEFKVQSGYNVSRVWAHRRRRNQRGHEIGHESTITARVVRVCKQQRVSTLAIPLPTTVAPFRYNQYGHSVRRSCDHSRNSTTAAIKLLSLGTGNSGTT